MTTLFSGNPAFAVCPGGPFTSETANSNLQYLAACQGSPTTCPEAPIPTVVVNSFPQEVVLRTSITEGFDPTGIQWRAERYDPATYMWVTVWEHLSDENLQGPVAHSIDFGAPGLTESATYAFRVAWRNADGSTCYSMRSSPVTPTSFSNVGPAPPAGTSYVAEDGFERPGTGFKCDAFVQDVGDGLGPNGVWMDCQIGTGGTVGPHIDASQGAAYFFPSSGATYMARHAMHWRNFAEAKVRVAENVGQGWVYNLQVSAREHFAGAPLEQRFYGAKLVYKIRECHVKPALMIFRFPDEYGPASCDDDGNPILDGGILIPDPTNPTGKCTEMPPLDVVDPETGTSYPVWLRIEVTDVGPLPEPAITATVAWGTCPDGQGIDACEFSCRATRIDTGDTKAMAFPPGGRDDRWGMSFHDKKYFVDVFRTGSEE